MLYGLYGLLQEYLSPLSATYIGALAGAEHSGAYSLGMSQVPPAADVTCVTDASSSHVGGTRVKRPGDFTNVPAAMSDSTYLTPSEDEASMSMLYATEPFQAASDLLTLALSTCITGSLVNDEFLPLSEASHTEKLSLLPCTRSADELEST